jgi:hypothetical protein
MNGHGDFVVSWTSSVNGSGDEVMAQLFNAAAVKQGGEFQVNTTTAGPHTADAVALDSAGNFVVTWEGNGVGDASGVFARRYSTTGTALGIEFRVNTTAAGTQGSSAMAMDPAGNFLVTWQSQGQDGDGWGIFGQRFNAAGVRQGGEFPVNVTTAGDQTLPSVAMNSAGDACVVWQGNGLGDGQGIFARRYVLPRISISDASVVEGNSGTTNMVFRVSLSSPSIWPVTVRYSTLAGTATPGSDYTAASGTITFLPNETLKTITVTVLSDTLYENNENFFLSLSAPTNGVLGRNQGTGTILNDDSLPTLSISDVTAAEPNGGTTTFSFTVTLSAASGVTITVQYATVDDTAIAGIDYLAKSGMLTFNPGVTSQTITITVMDDRLAKGSQNFYVLLSSPLNAALGKIKGVGTILDQ